MPFKRKRKSRRPRRRRRGNKRSSNRINSIVIRGPSAFPDRVFVRLKYTNSIAISTTSLIASRFAGNSVQRPDYQVTTQKCRGFLEWMAIYSNYKVHKSSIRVQVLNLDPSLTLDCVVLSDRGTPSFIDTEDAREQPYAKSKRISPLSGNTSSVSIFNSMKTKTIFGSRWIDDDYTGTRTTNPSSNWDWYVYVQNLVNDVGTVNCDISVSLTYFVEFTRRQFIPRSADALLR